MPPKKTMVLACSFEGPWLERFLAKQSGYSVIRCNSGAAAFSAVSMNEPDVLLVNGFALKDMGALDLIEKMAESFPNRKMRLVFMHNGHFEGKNDIQWNFGPTDVSLPHDTPLELLLPILEKMKEPHSEGNT